MRAPNAQSAPTQRAHKPRDERRRVRKVIMFLSNSELPPTLFHALTSAFRWTSAPKTSNFA